ncbi:hypothetical protein Cfor_01607 [Coptotermes formosanus]|uniref:Rho-GAP domain-containing protein n=1 Tax=Coptotermes formosanus TaxID=36987 RepID=A0A6L2QBH9_COPFO|nr:hypothetical protein Cfor_01607 [Coptotermes formosanus]
MRRPTLCSNVTAVEDCYSAVDIGSKEESRLSRVKRMLTGTLLTGRRGGSGGGRTFGQRLEELPLGRDGVPAVAVRLCSYIEQHGFKCGGLFRLSAGNPKLVERLRVSFDRTGDADLEGAGDVASAAALLKLWLRELPEPVIASRVAAELLDIHDKLHSEPDQWREAVHRVLLTLPDPNICLLRYLLRFLRHYEQHSQRTQCHHLTAGGVAPVFVPLLIHREVEQGRLDILQELMSKLIHECSHILQERLVDQAVQAAVAESSVHLFADASVESGEPVEVVVTPTGSHIQQHQHRKRKERYESVNSQSQERKVIRSNSEERPPEEGSVNCKDSIRRVSSHEDFSLVKGSSKNNNNINKTNGGKSFLTELIDPTVGHGVRFSGLPLHERNSACVSTPKTPASVSDNESTGVVPAEMFDDNEHERRRSSERFARAITPRGRRNMGRRRRLIHKSSKMSTEDTDGGGSSKENEDQEENITSSRISHTPISVSSSASDDDAVSNSGTTHSFLQLHPQERDRSPSPSPSPCTPPLDLATLHQQVDCNEPLRSLGNWSFAHRQPNEEAVSSQVLLSPRNSMILTRRVYLDSSVPPSPPHELNAPIPRTSGVSGNLDNDTRLKCLSKQVNSLKKKVKHYEEGFEREYGYRPSHADKMGNKDIKRMYTEMNKLRKEVKFLKEDLHCVMVQSTAKSADSVPEGSAEVNHGQNCSSDKTPSMEEKLQEVEKHLSEKRLLAGRSENLDELSREQLLDEKVAVQKALLYLEGIFGRPVRRGDRDLVRPLYDRYRALKRLVIRSGPSKLKDSMSELATILEHETMDFTSSPPSRSVQEDASEASADTPMKLQEPPESSDSLWENLHSLPLSELLNQQRTTREEKKRLRRLLQEFEEDFQHRTGKKLQREDRIPMESTYVAYKQAKAKLRLLEALVTKQT